MTGLHLLLFAAAVAATAPRLLTNARWVVRAPRLALAVWYAVLATWAGGAGSGLVLLATGWPAMWESACLVWAWCWQAAQGQHGPVARLAAGLVLLVATALLGRLAWSITRTIRASLRRRRNHAATVALVGRVDTRLDATVLAHPQPAAWLVPGRRGTVVVTSGALAQLSSDELACVLAHERAHRRGHHHLLTATVATLAQAMPTVALLTQARAQVTRLLEMCADDSAAAGRSLDLARALTAMAEAAAPAPATATLAATGGDALERVHRLLDPPIPLPLLIRAAITAGLTALVLLPFAWIAAAAALPALAACLPAVTW